jgi:hypothetical protein
VPLPIPKHALDSKIGQMLQESQSDQVISRRLFLYDFTYTFESDPARGFRIINTICENFSLPFSAVKIAGSAQTGYSYFKNREFTPTLSDLDIAIVSASLFQKYSEMVFSSTNRYTDLSKFPRKNGISTDRSFRDNLSGGFFRPDLMPHSVERSEWFSFFNRLSSQHEDLFKNINAGIYLSEKFFEMRNATLLAEYRKAQR